MRTTPNLVKMSPKKSAVLFYLGISPSRKRLVKGRVFVRRVQGTGCGHMDEFIQSEKVKTPC